MIEEMNFISFEEEATICEINDACRKELPDINLFKRYDKFKIAYIRGNKEHLHYAIYQKGTINKIEVWVFLGTE